MAKRILVVGGVAGGASAAARARRLDEAAEIVVFERGPNVSFASCGLPYHVGDVIPRESDLLLVTPKRFREQHGIDVRVRHEVTGIDRAARTVTVRDLDRGVASVEPWDALVLATGAAPIVPPFVPRGLAGVFTLRTIADAAGMKAYIEARDAKRAVVVGAGFIGLEIAENLVRRGLSVDIVDLADQVLAPFDPEMARPVAERLAANGVTLHLGRGVSAIRPEGAGLVVEAGPEVSLAADVVVLGIGVRPDTTLARAAGLEIGPTGGIRVDGQQRTSDPAIWAVGDVAEARALDGSPTLALLAGPASRQGRVAADAICGRATESPAVLGTAVVGAFGLTAAMTGLTEKRLRALGRDDHLVTWLHPTDHVSWFPGATTLHLKLVYGRDGRVLGAQAVGQPGVERRIDVVATAIRMGATVEDLEQLELAYAPQYGAPRDPVNVAGMIAANRLRGDAPEHRWEEVPDGATLVDVREPREFDDGHVPGATNVPLSRLRDLVGTLPTDRTLWLYCLSGKRSYNAARALVQRGFDARTLSGGVESWRMLGRGLVQPPPPPA